MGISKNYHTSVTKWVFSIFFKCPKIHFFNSKATFNGTSVTSISKVAQNNWNSPSKVNIGWARSNFLFFSQALGKQKILEANGCSSLNINFRWGVQLFWTAFDIPMTVVPWKVALGLEKIDFWAFQRNNQASICQVSFFDNFFKCLKIKFVPS